MGEMVEFAGSSGATSKGYLAMAGDPQAPGVIVSQEWWGLIDQITGVCDRLAEAGFTALAPDLYEGTKVPLSEPDDAAKEMMSLELKKAAAELSGAVVLLVELTGRSKIGVMGFCMGGGLALVLGAHRPDAVAAVIPCYGVHPWPEAHPDYTTTTAATQIHCAGLDGSFTPAAAEELAGSLAGLGLEVELHLYPNADHAFFNEDRPEVYDPEASALLWDRSVAFLHAHLAQS